MYERRLDHAVRVAQADRVRAECAEIRTSLGGHREAQALELRVADLGDGLVVVEVAELRAVDRRQEDNVIVVRLKAGAAAHGSLVRRAGRQHLGRTARP